MLHHETKEIGGRDWTVQAFPATTGLDVLARLLNLVGKSVGRTLGSFDGDLTKIDATVIGEALGELAERLSDGKVVELIKKLVSQVRVSEVDGDGNRTGKDLPVAGQFDVLFMQDYVTLFQVCAFVLEVNYRLPLAGWLTRVGTAASAQAPAVGLTSAK